MADLLTVSIDLAVIEATARKINPGRTEDHIKSVALDALSIIRALAEALPKGDADYLSRFPVEARPYCDRAYQDGYEDAAKEAWDILPPEFVAKCEDDGLEPGEVLKQFTLDLCALDGSGGSDERDFAYQWFERSFGWRRGIIQVLA